MHPRARRYFEIWGSEEAQNALLKLLLGLLSLLFLVETLALTALSLRKPTLIAVGEKGTEVLTISPPTDALLESEVKRSLVKYVESHYTWDASTIDQAVESASRYVSAGFLKAFQAANTDLIATVKAKKIAEKAYLSGEVLIDSKRSVARISLDRIFTVGGVRATSPLLLEIHFERGARSEHNPEGIYITDEIQVVEQRKGA